VTPAEASTTRVEHHPYTLGLDAGHVCEVGVGGACLELEPTDRYVTIDIKDASGGRADALVDFNDRYGAVHRTAAVCGKRRLRIPDSADHADIILQTFTLGLLGCAATQGPASATTGDIVATFETGPRRIFPKRSFEEPQDCGQQVPDSIGVRGVTDDGERISLDVIVLLDGVPKDVAKPAFAEAAKSYAPLGIALHVLSYRAVELEGSDAPFLISQSKALFGGAVPSYADVVVTMTSKDVLTVYDQPLAGGQADCIGGIRWGNRSFVLGVVLPPLQVDPLTFYKYGTARVLAHEIGHIMGAQHQMANCVEGATDLAPDDPTPCTLMSETADFDSRDFGTLEAAVVRGHAAAYAKP
jgi:reprolysin-like metallo-peptidase family M12B